ncbi:MAG TPA: carboxypeptidase regulatory-like domain-containing protein [Nocardioides sp.]|nr:carboxypeptidase regulatory-like domain-containing protein [Nocardioides sp.]
MPARRQWRSIMCVLAAVSVVLGLSLSMTGPAQAAGVGTGARTAPGHAADHQKRTQPHRTVDQTQKAAEAHYTNAPCNRAQKDYLERHLARCFSVVRTALDHQITPAADPPPTALGPADIQDAYNLPDSGDGMTVGIVDAFGNSHAESDLAQFRSYYGLPACTTANGCLTIVNQDGDTSPLPPDDPGWGLETSLDLDAVSAACPKCHILLVQGDDNSLDNLGIAVDTAVAMGAKFVSNSYGVPGEDPSELDFDHYYDHPGVAVTASTGDAGNVTNWPATSDKVVAVGGTTLTSDSSERGWNETAWADGGSGCSPYEPKPDFQQDLATNCDNRAIADISADADPATGLAVYDTLGEGGWLQVGGTSLSSPLVASMYALAGTPVDGTYPNSYPYADPSNLFDITSGSDGGCGNVLCNAGPGWDGPTGLGTPNGVSSLTTGPHGTVAGTVTDSSTGDPIAGATVSTSDGHSATTDSSGSYSLSLPVGTYDVTASAFGYADQTVSGVVVDEGQTVTEPFALDPVPSHTVSGTITDGSGAGWPIYAKITVDGTSAATYSDPFTGHYSLSLPEGATYTVHAVSQYPGYKPVDQDVTVGSSNQTVDLQAMVDPSTCSAKGYAYEYDGTSEAFSGWTGTTPQDGWTVTDGVGNGQTWNFDNPGNRAAPPGSDGDFAMVDSDHYGIGNSQDTSLVSPVIDLSDQTSPEIGFDNDYNGYPNQVGDVDVSTDAGATWTNVWEHTSDDTSGHVDIDVTDELAGQANAQVRFHFTGTWGFWWGVDDVFIGNRACVAQGGGLVAGTVRDGNTHQAVNGAKVASDPNPDEFGISAATPDDQGLPDGFYWLYSSQTGTTKFHATDGKYTPATGNVNVADSTTTRKNWTLKAGHLTVSPGDLSATVRLGKSAERTVTFGNDGTSPVHVDLSEQSGPFGPLAKKAMKGAPVQHIKGTFSTHAMFSTKQGAKPGARQAPARSTTPYAEPWQDIANYPTNTMDDAVAYGDGKVYSFGGTPDGFGAVSDAFVYDSATQAWSAIADVPSPVQAASAAYLGGKVYVIGGWNGAGNASSTTYIYDPSSDSWSQGADLPETVSAAGTAVLNGEIYVVAGCTTGNCAPSSTKVFSYDPGSDSWTPHADFPHPSAFTACGGVASAVVCAGGVNANTNATTTATYSYDPGSDSWTQVADMPADSWASVASAANGKLQVSGGVINSSAVVTNEGWEYDPASDSWADLPASNNSVYRGGGSCGMYRIGGSTGGFSPTKFSEVLPGYDQCGGAADVTWLSEDPTSFDVAPGQTVTVTVGMDSSQVDQPGTYDAKLGVATDSPYSIAPIGVEMQVTPPKSWGKVRGTVTNAATGEPIAGATVDICTMYDGSTGNCGPVEFTLKTDADGYYQLWLAKGYNPLQVIAAKDGYSPKSKVVRIKAGGTSTADFALKKS